MTIDSVEQEILRAAAQAASASPASAPAERPALRVMWRDHVRIGLGSNSLAVVRYRRGLRPALVEKQLIALDGPGGVNAWQAAIAALPAVLAGLSPRRTDVTVIVSNHFVRHALLPWNATLRSETEWLALARHRFSSVHGTGAADWAVRVAETAREGPRVAGAIDGALLAALEDRVTRPARLVSVQPYLMAAFNRLAALKRNGSAWFVIGEPGRLTLALIEHGAWRALRSRRMDDACRMTLPEILERESQMLGLEEPCMQIFLDSLVPLDFPTHGPYEVTDVTPGAAGGERAFAMAVE